MVKTGINPRMTKNGKRSTTTTSTRKGGAKSARAGRRQAVGQSNGPSGGGSGSRLSILDAPAKQYRQLLGNPCSGPLVPGVFGGIGTGNIIRTRTFVATAGGNRDSLLQFCPSYLPHNITGSTAGTTNGAYCSPIMFAEGLVNAIAPAVTGYSIAPVLFGFHDATTATAGVYSTARCLAACVKVHYDGTETARQGTVYADIGQAAGFQTVAAAANVVISTIVPNFQQSDRLGSRSHEYLWLPGESDAHFMELPGPQGGAVAAAGAQQGSMSILMGGSCLKVGCGGVPTGSCRYEVTAVWEVGVIATSTNTMVTSMKTSPSQNNLHQVVSSLGNVAAWALSPAGGRAIGTAFKTAESIGMRLAALF